jgi:hypothetical protein
MNELYVTHSIGNIFYKNGILVVNNTSSVFSNTLLGHGSGGYSIDFKGTHTIYEHEVLCNINPGEFNISTNPTSTIHGSIPYDINSDGVFDIYDLNVIMNYYYNVVIYNNVSSSNDNGILIQPQNPKQWYADELLISESDDVIWLEPLFENNQQYLTEDEILNNLNANTLSILNSLNSQGLLDINGDGVTSIEDARLLLGYFQGNRNYTLLEGNITPKSSRITSSDIIDFLHSVTGIYNGTNIISTMLNYAESSSIDPTGSYLAPYITTIGLYNRGDLVAVAKLGQPIKNPIIYPLNFLIRFDG